MSGDQDAVEIKNQAVADRCLSRAEEWHRLMGEGHFGKMDSEGYIFASGMASGFKRLAQDYCEHKMTVDAAGIGPMCKVCGKALEQGEAGDVSSGE